MSDERKRSAERRPQTTTANHDPEPPVPGGLLRQVRALDAIAQQAHERCVSGVDVERELNARRNASGQ